MSNTTKDQIQSSSAPQSSGNVSPFDIYKHIKANIKNIDVLCKHPLNEHSQYCLDCKVSTCPDCSSFDTHKTHRLLNKKQYYDNDPSLLNEQFKDIENIFNLNPTYLNVNAIKGELKLLIDNEIKSLINALTKIKNTKIEEVDAMFAGTDNCVSQLKKKVADIKKNIVKFFETQKEFFYLSFDTKEDENTQGNTANNDYANMIFLMNYDMINISNIQNKNIKNIILSIKEASNSYSDSLKEKVKCVQSEIDKLSEPSTLSFPYMELSKNFYKEIDDKISKYNENIRSIRQHVMDSVNKTGTFEEIEKKNILFESKQKQNIDNILNSQNDTINESMNSSSMTNKSKIRHFDVSKHLLTKNSSKNSSPVKGSSTSIPLQQKKYNSLNEINLNALPLQKYFTYLTMELINKNFRPNKKGSVDTIFADDFDEDIDVAKPIAGTNEVQIYDKKTRAITKKKVQFDKAKHKYTYFLTGCRSVVIKDRLYITGGVDKERKESNTCYVYYIKTNELKTMSDMIKPRAYHSISFLEYFKSILVIGGESNSTCELYDMYNSKWRSLPDLNYPRAYSCIYLDRMTNLIYTFFGIVSNMSEANSYIDVIECLDLKKTSLGWGKVDYKNKAEMDFKNGLCRIFPIDNEKILIYGASGVRESRKKAAIYMMEKQEIVKIDNKTFNEIRLVAKQSKTLNKIIANIQ